MIGIELERGFWKTLNECGCGLTEDNKVYVCPKHWVILISDSNLRYLNEN